MSPKNRPTEWAASAAAAVISLMISCGVEIPADRAAAITAVITVVTTAVVAAYQGRALPKDTVTPEDLGDGYGDEAI